MELNFFIGLFTMVGGVKDAKILGGRFARQNEFPFVVAISGDFEEFCGGVLVTLNKVVTAGHCVVIETGFGMKIQNSFIVTGGSLKRNLSADGMQSSQILSIQLHPKFDITVKGKTTHDIALCILLKPFDLSPSLRPMKWVAANKIEFREAWDKHVKSGNYCTAIGWGRSKMEDGKPTTPSPDLKALDFKPESEEYCDLFGTPRSERYETGEVCVSSLEDGADICSGDSGSPLICGGFVFAILSAKFGDCGIKDLPALYMLLGHYIDLYDLGYEHSSAVSSTFGQKCFLVSVVYSATIRQLIRIL